LWRSAHDYWTKSDRKEFGRPSVVVWRRRLVADRRRRAVIDWPGDGDVFSVDLGLFAEFVDKLRSTHLSASSH
jgi:hypothetical protein